MRVPREAGRCERRAALRRELERRLGLLGGEAILAVTTSLAFITWPALTTLPSFITAAVDITSAVG
jgi:hypothetical protein